MRIALHQTNEVGLRAGRILLGERNLAGLGVLERDTPSSDRRVHRAVDLSTYDALVTDATGEALAGIVERARAAEISCVIWADGDDLDDRRGFAAATLVLGANLARGLAPCLAAHEAALLPAPTECVIAWTEPGRPLRRGEAVTFPKPVGPLWAERRNGREPGTYFAAPVEGDWAGALARVTGAVCGRSVTHLVGVADLATHLEALSLAAGALTAASGEYAPGVHQPADAAEPFLLAALRAGLDVAVYRTD